MPPTFDPALRLTGTLVAQHFRFRCDRRLRWELAAGDAGIPERAAPRPGGELLTRAGVRFERRRVRELERRFAPEVVLSAGWTERGALATLRSPRVAQALREPGAVRWIVQPELVLPDPAAFARRHGFDPAIAIAVAKPDLIRVRRGRDGRPRFGVVDIKWSRHGTIQHFAQVAFYSLVLEELCRQLGVEGRVETRRGWLWTRGSRGPRPFALAGYRHHVAGFLREELPRAAAAAPAGAAWHFGAGCVGCGFFDHCHAEADARDDLGRVVGMTPLAAAELRARGIASVAALQKAAFRRDVYVGCHALEANAPALRARVKALSFGKLFDVEGATHRMAADESLRVCVTAEGDPVTGRVFALGLRADRGRGVPDVAVRVAEAGTAAGERAMLHGFAAHLADVLASAAAGGEPSFQLYVYDRVEAELLRGLMQRHLGDAAALPAIASLAERLLPRGAAAGTAPGAVLLDVLAELFALPVPYAWDLASVSAALQPSDGPAPYRPGEGFAAPFSSQLPFERIHQVWSGAGSSREEIARVLEGKLAAVDSVIRALRERVRKRPDRPRLLMRAARLVPAPPEAPLADPGLERLRTFAELEAAEQSIAVRQLHAMTAEERAARFECIRGLERVQIRADGAAVFEFDAACRDVKFRPGDFALLLTNDDGTSLTATHTRPWLARRMRVELVEFDLVAQPPRVVLASEYGWDRLEAERLVDFSRQCVLDRAELDFNTRRIVATLRALDADAGESRFARELVASAVPGDWLPTPLYAEVAEATLLAPAARTLGRDVLNAEQHAAWQRAFEAPASVVWGPPGTGKTYLLAWTLLGLAAAARAAGRPLRILVSAATHRAIVNALVRLSAEATAAGLAAPPRLVKLVGRPNEADRDLAGTRVERVPEAELREILAGAEASREPIVVGATPWALWKQMRDANDDGVPVRPLFDVVVVDEASQIRLVDALIPLSSIRAGGRAILYGDDRQLAPIVRGAYDDDTRFGSAFAHLAAALGRSTLRESRRMNRALVRYPRRHFYPGLVSRVPDRRLALRADPGADPADRMLREIFLREDDAVVFCVYRGVRAAARNPWEAALVADIAGLARRTLADPSTGALHDDASFRREAFAVISPHRAQNSAILAALAARGWPADALPVVDTVERMQGNERDMVVVSYGVADREYAEREAAFLLDPNRFNVAITRARAKLVVLVSEEVLRALPRDEKVMADSLALKGYSSAPGGEAREILLPGPEGGAVAAVCHTWRVGGRERTVHGATSE